MDELTRRSFLGFLGKSALTVVALPPALSFWGCAHGDNNTRPVVLPGFGLPASRADEVRFLAPLRYEVLLSWGDYLDKDKTLRFGDHADFNAFIPIQPGLAYLWTNHEQYTAAFVDQTRDARWLLGGSYVVIAQEPDGRWKPLFQDPRNGRIDGQTPIPIVTSLPMVGGGMAMGTLGNCAGGVTPWNTVLTCEENFQDFYKDPDFKSGEDYRDWDSRYKRPTEHYGWVVEVNPRTGKSKKLTSLGRFSHEGATVVRSQSTGMPVVYMGDDAADQFVYKFIASRRDSLDEGTLYVADFQRGQWLSLDHSRDPLLKRHFSNQLDVLIHCRQAAKLLGATPCNRPEDIEVNPSNQEVLVTFTNNRAKNDLFGSIGKISQKDHADLTMTFSVWMMGGQDIGFACPDNLAFDKQGNLWITTDISGSSMGKGPYAPFGNNALLMVPLAERYRNSPHWGVPIRVATAPIDAELTGPTFSDDGKTLFISVQHPGSESESVNSLTSRWNLGVVDLPTLVPRSAVLAVTGFEELLS